MAGAKVEFDQAFFDGLMRTAGIQSLQQAAAQRVLAAAQASAPVKTGAYKRGLRITKAERKYRTAFLVEGTAPHTLLVEAKTGNLARALKSAGRG
jgi:hypothetical protein